jgi:hypothetical protein
VVLGSEQPATDRASVLLGLALLALGMGPVFVALVWARFAKLSTRGRLRRCPLCHADAIRDLEAEMTDSTHACVGLQCGECATWRRFVAPQAELTWEVKRFESDRRLISDQAQRLSVDRRERSVEAFAALLEHDIVGAEDFLAFVRRSHTARP